MIEPSIQYPAPGPHGLMFHHFTGSGHPPTEGAIDQSTFEEILDFINEGRILAPEEWLDRLDRDRLEAQHLCLTFDDALASQLDVALSVLEKRGLKAFWFVYSGVFEGRLERLEIYRVFRNHYFSSLGAFYDAFFNRVLEAGVLPDGDIDHAVKQKEIDDLAATFPFYSLNDIRFRLLRDRVLGRETYQQIMDEMISERGLDMEKMAEGLWMTDDDLRYLRDRGHTVGLHSYSHPTALAKLPVDEQRREYRKNFQHIENVTGLPPRAAAHPSNSYGAETLAILDSLGIRVAFRSNLERVGKEDVLNPSRLEMAREDHANVVRLMTGDEA